MDILGNSIVKTAEQKPRALQSSHALQLLFAKINIRNKIRDSLFLYKQINT